MVMPDSEFGYPRGGEAIDHDHPTFGPNDTSHRAGSERR